LNDFIALGKPKTKAVRGRLIELFTNTNTELRNDETARKEVLLPMAEVEMVMPVYVPSYTDFYSSIEHATNIGSMIRDPENALMPNWKHIPVGYHGRSSSIIISGEAVHRPKGQTKAPDSESPVSDRQNGLILSLRWPLWWVKKRRSVIQ
jgi:fumarylacetoacetase